MLMKARWITLLAALSVVVLIGTLLLQHIVLQSAAPETRSSSLVAGSTSSSTGTPQSSTSTTATVQGGQAQATSHMLFDDEFNGTSLDLTKWTILNRPGDASNNEEECYRPTNVSVTGGALLLTDRADTSCSGYAVTSAMVQTTRFHFLYGTLDIRARMPSGQGQWPALWLLGENCQETNISTADNVGSCAWPVAGSDEIDLFEGQNANTTTGRFNILTGDAPNNANWAQGCNGVPLTLDVSTGYHVYSLIWAPGSVTWQVDRHTYCSFTTHVPSTAMFIIMNIAVGGGIVGESIDFSRLPQTMSVDYVRVYQ